MEAGRGLDAVTQRLAAVGKPVAHVFGLPLLYDEALAFDSFQAGAMTDRQRDTLQAWVVKMTLVHGMWVSEQVRFWGADEPFIQTRDASPT